MGEQTEGDRRTSAATLTFPDSSLLRTKLRPPEPAPHFVVRQRLYDLLDDLVESPLTVVVAPAGAGKTQLLSGWVEHTDVACAWLSIDELDRDPTQLWAGVMRAIDPLAPGLCEVAASLLLRGHPPEEVVARLLNDLDAAPTSPRAAVLIIDDVHHIEDEELARSLASFVLHLPLWLHVILSSRRAPNLPIDRLRARGQLAELHFAELRFSAEESFQLLARLVPAMSEQTIESIAARADGWAVALQMTALAARANGAQPPTAGPALDVDSLVDDFVWHELLASEADSVVDLLLDVCVTDRVNASLAAALTRGDDAGAMLGRVEARGLFVHRLGVSGWFQIHSLVRSALRSELARRSPDRLREQHARAARWFQDEGEVAAALEHWLLGRRYRDALHLLAAKHAELYDSGREATILGTIAAIPVAEGTTGLDAMVEYAWAHLLVDRAKFIESVRQAAWWVAHEPHDAVMAARVTMLRSIVAVIEGDWNGCGLLARQALDALGDDWWRDPLGRFGWNMLARQLAYSEAWHDSADAVLEAELALGRDPERRATLEGTRSLGQALAGQPVDALRSASGVWHLADVANMTILRTELLLAQAIAHRELGDRPRALEELQQMGDAPTETMLMCRVLALLELADAHLDTYDVDAARTAFASAESLVGSGDMGGGVVDRLAGTGVQLALHEGDLVMAREWADRITDPFWAPVNAARVELAAGHIAEAAALLDVASPRCVRHEVVLGLLRARSSDGDEASKHAAAALELAASHELLQTVATEGAPTVDLLERCAWRVPVGWMERLRRVIAASGGRPPPGRPQLVEQLTERERDVLRYLPSRLTVREIANELYVSVNTLKFHLKVIYRKLGVTSRAEAAARARELLNR
jgi:LuxR family maltose regulon positive regulatory protein